MASGLGLTYTASATWQNAANAVATCAVSWNITLPVVPSGASGYWVINTTSGIPPSAALVSVGTTTVSVGGCVSGSSGIVYGIVGYSMIG